MAADGTVNSRGIAPNPLYPERTNAQYERKLAVPGDRRGPMRFQEGIATDTDVPRDFVVGALQGHEPAPGRFNHNKKVDTKYPQETLQQRAHVGSASWVEAPESLAEFAQGAFNGYDQVQFERTINPEQRRHWRNPATVVE